MPAGVQGREVLGPAPSSASVHGDNGGSGGFSHSWDLPASTCSIGLPCPAAQCHRGDDPLHCHACCCHPSGLSGCQHLHPMQPAPAADKNTLQQQGSPVREAVGSGEGGAGLFSEGCGTIPGRSILIQPAQVQQLSLEAPYLGPGRRRGGRLNWEHCPGEEEGRQRM